MSINRMPGLALCLLSTAASICAALSYNVSWIGNSFNGKTGWVLQDVADISVEKNGTLFTNVGWDGGGGNTEQIRNGVIEKIGLHSHEWGYEGGDGVASNSRHLYVIQNVGNESGYLVGNSWPPAHSEWSGISRRLRADISTAAPFTAGHGVEGAALVGSFLPVNVFPDASPALLRGIAASETRVYVSTPSTGVIAVYDASTMASLATWNVVRCDKLALDTDGYLWIVQRPATTGSPSLIFCPAPLRDLQHGGNYGTSFRQDQKKKALLDWAKQCNSISQKPIVVVRG